MLGLAEGLFLLGLLVELSEQEMSPSLDSGEPVQELVMEVEPVGDLASRLDSEEESEFRELSPEGDIYKSSFWEFEGVSVIPMSLDANNPMFGDGSGTFSKNCSMFKVSVGDAVTLEARLSLRVSDELFKD